MLTHHFINDFLYVSRGYLKKLKSIKAIKNRTEIQRFVQKNKQTSKLTSSLHELLNTDKNKSSVFILTLNLKQKNIMILLLIRKIYNLQTHQFWIIETYSQKSWYILPYYYYINMYFLVVYYIKYSYLILSIQKVSRNIIKSLICISRYILINICITF